MGRKERRGEGREREKGLQEEDLPDNDSFATGTEWLSEARKDNGSNKLDIWERRGALRSCCKKKEKRQWCFFSQECPRGSGGLLLVHLLHSPSCHLVELPSLCSHTHANFPCFFFCFFFSPEKHKLSTYKSISTTSFLLLVLLPYRSPSCPRFVYFTPLHNAGINFSKPIWAAARFGKERSAELLCWGKFPLHTSLEVDCSPRFLCRLL